MNNQKCKILLQCFLPFWSISAFQHFLWVTKRLRHMKRYIFFKSQTVKTTPLQSGYINIWEKADINTTFRTFHMKVHGKRWYQDLYIRISIYQYRRKHTKEIQPITVPLSSSNRNRLYIINILSIIFSYYIFLPLSRHPQHTCTQTTLCSSNWSQSLKSVLIYTN